MWSTLDMCSQEFSNTGAESKAMKWTRTLRKYSYKKENSQNQLCNIRIQRNKGERSEGAKECTRVWSLGSRAEKGFGGGRTCWHGMLQMGQVRVTRRFTGCFENILSFKERSAGLSVVETQRKRSGDNKNSK